MSIVLVTLLVAAAVFVADFLSKQLITSRFAPGESHTVIPGVLRLQYVRNPGAAYGMLTGNRWLLALIAAAVIVGGLAYAWKSRRRWEQMAIGLLLGGALGNLVDRLRFGLVTDFLEIPPLVTIFQVFNVADVAITAAAVLIVLAAVLSGRKEQTGRGR